MPKLKKKIVHISRPRFYKPICGTITVKNRLTTVSIHTPMQMVGALLHEERFCHKCKHIHKLNLAKVKE